MTIPLLALGACGPQPGSVTIQEVQSGHWAADEGATHVATVFSPQVNSPLPITLMQAISKHCGSSVELREADVLRGISPSLHMDTNRGPASFSTFHPFKCPEPGKDIA